MATISIEQMNKIIDNAPMGMTPRQVIEGMILRGHDIEDIDPVFSNSFRQVKQSAGLETGNQFVEQPKTFWQKAKKLATDVIGGGELARGLGLGVAAPEVQENVRDAALQGSDLQLELTKKIQDFKQRGLDTTRLEAALADQDISQRRSLDVQGDFVENLPSNKQVIGSAGRLAATAALPTLTRGVNTAVPAAKPGIIPGAVRGAGVGAATGAVEGAAQGAGIAAEQDASTQEVLQGAGAGAVVGAGTGGVIGGTICGFAGRKAKLAADETLFENITPKADELTKKDYQKFLAQGRVSPKTGTQPARVELPETLQRTALKHRDVITKDPVETSVGLTKRIGEIDDEVGRFLRQNNGIFSKGELRNYLNTSLEGLDDVNVPEERLQKAKDLFVKNFIDSVESNDMESLWMARKNFDRAIEGAFRGSPTLKKQAQVSVRNAVQDFIADRTPDATYSEAMQDMSRLFRIRDYVGMKAGKERAQTAIKAYLKENPALGWLATTALGIFVFNQLQGTIGAIGGNNER